MPACKKFSDCASYLGLESLRPEARGGAMSPPCRSFAEVPGLPRRRHDRSARRAAIPRAQSRRLARRLLSFDAWEWPRRRPLRPYAPVGAHPRRPAEGVLEDWYARQIAAGLPPLTSTPPRPCWRSSVWRLDAPASFEAIWATGPPHCRGDASYPDGGFQHDVSDRVNHLNCGTTRCLWSLFPRELRRSFRSAPFGR